MKVSLILSLIFVFLTGNLFAQSNYVPIPSDSLSKNENYQQSDSSKLNKKSSKNKSPQKLNEASSDEKQGILIGAIVGAATGVGIGALLSNFSMEPHSHYEYSFGTAVVCGVVGAFVGGIVGGLISK